MKHIEAKKTGITVYLSGPITGVSDYKERFAEYQVEMQKRGWAVLNPATLPRALDDRDAMRICFTMIDAADIVVFLPGWKKSRGAKLERAYCNYTDKGILEISEGTK